MERTSELSAPTPAAGEGRADPYLLVSVDGHVGPSLMTQLRPYCPSSYLESFDSYAHAVKQVARGEVSSVNSSQANVEFELRGPEVAKLLARPPELDAHDAHDALRARRRAWECEGQQDPHARHRDMDADGIAADVIFAGGQNGEVLPFLLFGFEQGSAQVDLELRTVGSHIYNSWLADFVSAAPERHVGVMQVAIADVDSAVAELGWGREAGLRAVNLPAPQRESAPYTDPAYESFWAACEDLDIPLLTHTGGGDPAHGIDGPMGIALTQMEMRFMSRRGLWQLILGGVFERHPRLKIMFTENGVTWLEDTLRDLDSLYFSESHRYLRDALSLSPSQYWTRNCFIGGSFLAPYEVAARDVVGIRNLCWGSDYPHTEGTWPNTRLALRHTFANVPEAETRLILGENALSFFDLDEAALRPIADRIGPHPSDLAQPLRQDEFPAFRGFAFRERGAVS